MVSEEKFDVIVVGAGPAGLGAAYMLAKYGFNVLVIERGERVGAKNVFGGRIYSHVFEKVIPEFRKEAPIERWVKKERMTFMTDEDAVTIEFSSKYPEKPYDSFTTYLSTFTKWLAKIAYHNFLQLMLFAFALFVLVYGIALLAGADFLSIFHELTFSVRVSVGLGFLTLSSAAFILFIHETKKKVKKQVASSIQKLLKRL